MYQEEVDIIIGLPWFKSLGTFILNMEKKFVTFPYKEKMITLQDTTSEPDSVTPKDFNDISEVILQENKKAMQRMKKNLTKLSRIKAKKFLVKKNTVKNFLHRSRSQRFENNVFRSWNKRIKNSRRTYQKKMKKILVRKASITSY
jgi:hypothetical protein